MTNAYSRSVIFIILGGALLSTLGISVRLMDGATSLQIVFFRAISLTLFITIVTALQNPKAPWRPFIAIGWRGLLVSLFLAGASLFMVLAVVHTSVANAMFIVSLAPLASAILGMLILKERVSTRTWTAIAIAVSGVAIIVLNELSGDGVLGMIFAFCMMLCYSSSMVAIRSRQDRNMFPASAISGLIQVCAVFFFIESFDITAKDLTICLVLGVFQVGLAMLLIITGARHVPAAQVSLLALLEVVLSPIWVWIGVGETPASLTLVGGLIVLAGVTWQALGGLQQNAKPQNAA